MTTTDDLRELIRAERTSKATTSEQFEAIFREHRRELWNSIVGLQTHAPRTPIEGLSIDMPTAESIGIADTLGKWIARAEFMATPSTLTLRFLGPNDLELFQRARPRLLILSLGRDGKSWSWFNYRGEVVATEEVKRRVLDGLLAAALEHLRINNHTERAFVAMPRSTPDWDDW